MLGPARSRDADRPVLVSLDALVPKDNLYRPLDTTLDLSFVRDWVKDCYANIGRLSVDPVVFFRLQLVMHLEGLRSERQLLRLAVDRLSVRWSIGHGLDEPLPDHSTLTRIRERYRLEIFRRFFDAVVERCVEAGLVWGKEFYIDATKVQANASLDSVTPRFAVDDHLRNLFDHDDPWAARYDRPVLGSLCALPGTLTALSEPAGRLLVRRSRRRPLDTVKQMAFSWLARTLIIAVESRSA